MNKDDAHQPTRALAVTTSATPTEQPPAWLYTPASGNLSMMGSSPSIFVREPDATRYIPTAGSSPYLTQTTVGTILPPVEPRIDWSLALPNRALAAPELVTSRAYPHILEAAQPALALVAKALEDARKALESYDDSDIESVSGRLSLIAVSCADAHSLTRFNESFGAVVSFVRRATLIADSSEVSRPALNVLISVLAQIRKDPNISLMAAGELVGALSEEGWRGEHKVVDQLLALFLSEAEPDATVTEAAESKE